MTVQQKTNSKTQDVQRLSAGTGLKREQTESWCSRRTQNIIHIIPYTTYYAHYISYTLYTYTCTFIYSISYTFYTYTCTFVAAPQSPRVPICPLPSLVWNPEPPPNRKSGRQTQTDMVTSHTPRLEQSSFSFVPFTSSCVRTLVVHFCSLPSVVRIQVQKVADRRQKTEVSNYVTVWTWTKYYGGSRP
jgi:hypothetical protein